MFPKGVALKVGLSPDWILGEPGPPRLKAGQPRPKAQIWLGSTFNERFHVAAQDFRAPNLGSTFNEIYF